MDSVIGGMTTNGKKRYTLNGDVYLAQLDRLKEAIKVKRPRKKNHIIFHHDNAKPHVRADVVEWIDENFEELLPHSPYSPDAAATDYHVMAMANWMHGKIFDDFYEMVDSVKGWIASKNRKFFTRGIDLLPEKWQEIIDADGDYAH
uniref:Transposase n=1 Tax=Ditylenchus dipsaci TaxID=166011 RepID=A0A915DH51_9BILA